MGGPLGTNAAVARWIARLSPERRSSLGNEDSAAHALAAVVAEVEAACPGRPVDDALLNHLIERLSERQLQGAASLAEKLGRVRAAELCLAFHCARGDAEAIAWFERTHLQPVVEWLVRQRIAPSLAEEVAQVMRERLLAGAPAKIADFSGTGDLRAFVRVIAMREALYLKKRGLREVPASDRLLEVLPATGDPELDYLREVYGAEFRQAFVAALEGLAARERNLLRQSYLRGLSIDQLGALYGVHRATAARWVSQAEERLLLFTRQQLMARLDLESSQVDSLLRLLGSRIDVSVRRHLGAEDE
jgi:RNA polymerase sigma-70 factor (ECF subfamily)